MTDLNKPRLTPKDFYFWDDDEFCFCKQCDYYGEPDGCNKKSCSCDAYDLFTKFAERLQELENAIEDGELVQAVHGEWVLITAPKKYAGGIVCSNCKKSTDWQYNYCPNCGAKMDLEDGK